jgi:hypothetical protein
MKQESDVNEYSLENLSKLPKNQQAEIYFGVAQLLFRRNQGMIAAAYMTRALNLDPDLLALGICDTYEEEDWVDI